MKTRILNLIFCGLFAVQSTWISSSQAQTSPPEDFLNEDDFDAPPPGTFVPPEPIPPGPEMTPPPPDTFQPPPGGGPGGPSGLSPGGSNTGGDKSGTRKRRPISEALSDEITNENYPDLIDSFDYPNAEVTDIIKAMSELTGKNFIIDPGVRGKITIIAPTKITVAEAWKAFLSALAINGWSIVPSGKFFKVKSARDARNDSIETYAGPYSPDNDQMITRIIHLKHIQAADVNSKLRTLQSKFGDINVYEPTNSLIISDFGSNVERISSILKELDVKGFEEQLEVIQIRYAKAKDIADLMDQIINKGERRRGQGAQSGFTSGIPRFGQPQSKGAGEAFSLVIPDDRTNAIIVVGNKAGIQKIRELVLKLDRRVRPDEAGGVYVYYVKHGDAEKIAQTLSGLASDAKKGAPAAPIGGNTGGPAVPPAEQVQPIFGGEVKIAAAKETNSLIITASRQDYQVILNIMRKIDIPRDQVYVEAVILEMTAGTSNNYNISYFGFNKDSGGLARTGFSSGGIGAITDITTKGAILGFGSGEKVKITLPGGAGEKEVTSTLGFINFLKSISSVNVLSTPQVLAMDNEDAELKVQNTIPVAPTTTQGATSTQQGITREDVGITLKIKPHISRTDETIRLEIEQTVSDVTVVEAVAASLAAQSTSTSKRQLKSQIVVRDGDTAVLGGLMKDQERENVQKIPLLGDIPILGWLFKGKTSQKEKVNLLVFLTPKILRSSADRFKLLSEKMLERNDYIRSNTGGRDPFGAAAEKMARKADEALKQGGGGATSSGAEEDIPLNEGE